MDYVIADDVAVPPEDAAVYTENVVYMPYCYQANDNRMAIGKQPYTRSLWHLPETAFVFCSFNQPYKIDAPVFAIWMDILRQVDHGVLWLIERSPLARENLRRAADQAGIDPARLVFAGFVPLEDNLARLQHADVVLDTLIYNGGATTSNALWAGVPVLTLPGGHWVSRMSASALKALGLPDMIAHDPEDYVRKAVDLALNPVKLEGIRSRLRHQRSTTPLFDTAMFTGHMEYAYQKMWQRHVQGMKPKAFQVPAGEASS